MDKRTFLKLSSALTMAPFLTSIESLAQQERLKNWAGNLEYSTSDVHYPKSVAEVQDVIKKFDKVKALGTRHCFNDIADSKHHLLSTKELNKIISIDRNASTVTIEGGMNYGQLCPQLDQQGFALHNLASLPHISVAGACTTATHGSGVGNGNLATVVTAIELVTADGSIVTLSKEKDGERFNAAVVGLGALGVITKITLALKPSNNMSTNICHCKL
jgi:xylitol oxidase